MFWDLYKVELLSTFFCVKVKHRKSGKYKKDSCSEAMFMLRRTVFCKNCDKYSLICLKSQYYFINCSCFFLS